MTVAALKASWADFKLLKGRRVAQLIFEVPLEQADGALAALGGLPRPDAETWVGIARLEKEAKPSEPQPLEAKREHRRFSELPLSQQAGIMAKDPGFHDFLRDKGFPYQEEDAAKFIRNWCNVTSRSELDSNQEAAESWFALLRQCDAWRFSSKARTPWCVVTTHPVGV